MYDVLSPDYAYWLLHPHWKPEVAACLLIGANPLAYYSPDPPPGQWPDYRTGWLPPSGLRGMDHEHQALLALIRLTGMTRPADLIRWRLGIEAETLPTPVPNPLVEWLDKQPLPVASDPVPAADLAKYPRQQRKTAKQGPRKATIAKVIDRGKTLMQNDTLPEFETVWSSIQTKAPAGVLYLSDSDALTTQEGDETLTRTNARRAYEAHRAKSR